MNIRLSDALWWVMFFFAYIFSSLFFFIIHTRFLSSWFLPPSYPSYPLIFEILVIILVSLALTWPAIVPIKKKKAALTSGLIIFTILVGTVIHTIYVTPNIELGGLALIFELPVFAAVVTLLIALPIFFERIAIQGRLAISLASILILIEVVCTLFLFCVVLYATSLSLAINKNENKSQLHDLCIKLNKVSLFADSWREYYRANCPLGFAEELPFPVISDEKLKEVAQNCDVKSIFAGASGLNGLCLNDHTGYVTANHSLAHDLLWNHNHPDWKNKCVPVSFDQNFFFWGPDKDLLEKMQALCVKPVGR